MAGAQKVNGVDLKNLENNLGSVLESMDKQVRGLQTAIDELAGRWSGIGAAEFKSQQGRINQDHVALQKILSGIRTAIGETRRDSGANDENVLQSMRGIEGNGVPLSSVPQGTTMGSMQDTGVGSQKYSGFDKF
ncbi:WXG100 family type VII secretion target [Streptomyces sp. XM4193]|uniref:WXG100 family type VII secretion target n=1 Tax=Streptomyces sp. XM4193 TaxID=2929782 RepID=UPI001FFA5F8B|nr:WXG100 family type VII secretion target [Streptomyces sp. XM4193]MCK1797198.1 WXG100 family type VII secretion target [Streptomyces sp. XM4193]